MASNESRESFVLPYAPRAPVEILVRRVRGRRSENLCVADRRLRIRRAQIRELRVLQVFGFAHEAAFLEHMPRRRVLAMDERVHAAHAQGGAKVQQCNQRLRCITVPPGIARQHVSSSSLFRRLKTQTRAPEKSTGSTRFDEIGPCRPRSPFQVAETEECARILDRLMPRPGEVARHVRVARIARKDRVSIVRARPTQDESCSL